MGNSQTNKHCSSFATMKNLSFRIFLYSIKKNVCIKTAGTHNNKVAEGERWVGKWQNTFEPPNTSHTIV